MVVIQVTFLVFMPGLDVRRFKLWPHLKKSLKIPKGGNHNP